MVFERQIELKNYNIETFCNVKSIHDMYQLKMLGLYL